MSLQYPKHLHSPKDNGDFVVVQNDAEEKEQRKAGWLIAPPSQTRGQEDYARQQREAATALPSVEDYEADVDQPPPKKVKHKKVAS